MVNVICEKTGLEFEAKTSRTKNHPSIMNRLNEASKRGWYRMALSALEEGREKRLTTVEQFLALLDEAEAAKDEQDLARIRRERAEKEARQQARMQRIEQNRVLNANGYNWHKDVADEEDADLYGARDEWYLTAPDGRVVSLKQAMLELAFYQNLAYAKEWLKSRNIAEELPKVEVERREKAEAERAQAEQDALTLASLDAEHEQYFQEAKAALLEAGLSEAKAIHQALAWSRPHTPQEAALPLGPITPDHSAMLAINSDLRYGAICGRDWYGLDEIIEMYPNDRDLPAYLSPYMRRNEVVR